VGVAIPDGLYAATDVWTGQPISGGPFQSNFTTFLDYESSTLVKLTKL